MKPAVRYLLHLLLVFAATSGLAQAQSGDAGKFPVAYGPSNLGKEFYFSFPTNYEDPGAAMKYIRLYITAPTRTRVQIYTGSVLKKTLYTVPNDIVVFDLTKFEAQAVSRDPYADIPPDRVYKRKAVHIIADAPIVVYGMNRTSFTSDGMLIFPVNALGTDYVVASARDVITGGTIWPGMKLPSQFLVTAAFDNTTVSIETPWQTTNYRAGEVYSFRMDKGDVFSSMSVDAGGDLTGATISASKPVAVTAGQNCTYLPDQRYRACDHIEEMMLPVSTWGNVYHSVPFATRLKGDMYRIFAAEENTDVFINGVKRYTLTRRGGPEGYGWVEYLPPTRELVEFTSNKPIMVAQYNNSQQYDQVSSDPFYLVLTPVEQYQTAFLFATPAPGDFSSNYMTVVGDSAGYAQIEISPTSADEWRNLSQLIPRAIRNFTTRINGRTYMGVTFDIDPGAYKIRGPLPFAAYVYGFGAYDSYGYPLSAALSDLRSSDVDRPLVDKTQDCNGFVLADVLDMPDDVKIRSNLASIDLVDEESFNYLLDIEEFEAGVSPGTTYRLTVVNKALDARAVVVILDKAGNVTYDTVTYAAFKISVDTVQKDFGSYFAGENGIRSIIITNGASKPALITQTTLQKGNVGFTILDPTSPFTLGPKGSPTESKEIRIRFDATAAGRFTDSLGFRDTCGFRYVALVRAFVGTPIISVSDIPFGSWPVTAPPSVRTFTITNVSDGGELLVNGVAQNLNDNVTFTLPNGLPAFPLALLPGEVSNPISVGFKPNAVQAYVDSIVFNHNAPPNPLNDPTAVLTGRGIQGSLIATSFDWGRRRVDGNSYQGTIQLTNVGSSDVVLLPGAVMTGDNTDFIIVDPSDYAGKTLTPGASVDVRVQFTPTATGRRSVTITWPHNPQQAEPVTSTLLGFGTLPSLTTTDYDFGSMDVSDANDVIRQIEFRLPPVGNPDVMDSVTIIDFTITGDVNDFRFDKPALPIVLKRGNESVVFNGYFNATVPGPRSAQVTAVTRAGDNVNVTSNWTGVGTVKDPFIEGDPVTFGVLCASSSTLNAVIRNTGVVLVVVNDLQLQGLPASFAINPMPTFPFTIAPGESRSIPISYTASGNGVFDGNLVVFNNSSNASTLALRVTGASVEQDVDVAVDLSALGPLGKVELGQEFLAMVNMTEAINPVIPIRNYRVTLTYDPEQTAPDEAGIAVGSANPTAAWSVVSNAPGALVLDVNSPAPLGPTGTLIEVPFAVYFHPSQTRTIDASVTTNDAACLTYTTTPDSIAVVPICGLSVRLITMNATTYALNQNVPNPFNPVTKISYSLGLDGRTHIALRDAAGKLVQVLLDEVQQPGTYELTLDVTDLPSGIYYYTLTSGQWSDTKAMMVTK